MGDKKAAEKTSQALREKIVVDSKDTPAGFTSPTLLLPKPAALPEEPKDNSEAPTDGTAQDVVMDDAKPAAKGSTEV